MPVAVKGTGGGSVTLTAGAAASDTTLTLPNTTGTVALTASPTFSGTVTATTVTSPASTALTIQSAGTTAMTVSTSQNVGIGTTSPGAKFAVSDGTVTLITSPFSAGSTGYFGTSTNHSLAIVTNNTEKMRLDTSGSLQINTTTLGGIVKFGAYSSTADAATYVQIMRNSAGTDLFVVRSDGLFITGNAANSPYNFTTASAANVTIDSNGWMYRSTSSSRYKINVQDYGKGLADLIKLRPVTFNSKPRDGDDTPDTKTYAGFIAEEVDAAGLTEFVQYNADNQPDALAYANMVALLTAAIQELSAKNDALEARLAALEAK